MRRFLPLLLAAALVLCLLASCGGAPDLSGYIVRYDLTSAPRSLDPQLAVTSESLMVVENTFEGLLRQGESGELLPGVARDFAVSSDGMTYTFHLRENAMWSDGATRVTAADFVFAFQRVVTPATGSDSASSFLCIRNAASILAGQLPVTSLGVRAQDDYTLVVTLDTPNPFFPQVMASAAAMPCNQKFFEAQKGRYGLEPKYLMFNGPFSIELKSYDPQKQLRLRANKSYQSARPTVAGGANLYIQLDDKYDAKRPDVVLQKGEEKLLTRFYAGRTDAAPVSYADVDSLSEDGKVGIYSFENIVWGLAFNCKTNTYGTEKIRRAFALAMDPASFAPYLKDNLTPADAIVPSAIKLLDKPYRDLAGGSLRPARDTEAARALFREGLSDLEVTTLSKTSILCPEGGSFPALLGQLQRQLQDSLGVFINVEPLPLAELNARVTSGDYMIALLPLTATRNSPEAVLGYFSGLSTQNVTGFSSPELDDVLSRALAAGSIRAAADLYEQAERLLMDSAVFLPVAYETSYYASSPLIRDLNFSPFSYRIFFKYAYQLKE